MKTDLMKIFKMFHNPDTERYAIYYSIVLTVIIGTVLVQNFGLIHVSPIEGTAVFAEGFICSVMLARHSRTKENFPHHISKLKQVVKLPFSNI